VLHAYRAQESHLDTSMGAIGPVGMMRTQQGRAISYTMWSEGQPVLMPETDLVVFTNAQGKPLGMYVRQTLPRIPELKGSPVDIWGPRRVRYEGFPTEEQRARLECVANAEQVLDILKTQDGFKRPAPGASLGKGPSRPAPGGASPVPPHLRGISLGVQSKDE
jgi:hypothetical protein